MQRITFFAIAITLLSSCGEKNTKHSNKTISTESSDSKIPLVKKFNLYAFDSAFVPYMPDTTLSFNTVKEATKYNMSALKKIDSFDEVYSAKYAGKGNTSLAVQQASIQFNNLQQLIVFRQLQKGVTPTTVNLLSFFSPYSSQTNLKERIQLYNSLPQEIKNSAAGRKTWQMLQEYSFDKNIGSNMKMFSDVRIADSNNVQRHIQDIFDRSHEYYMFIFGASWCSACRLNERLLKKWISLVDTSRIKIIGLSIDKDFKKWINYLRTDQLPWASFLLSGEMNNPMVKKLSVPAIPMNFLVSKDGKIVLQNTDFRKILIWLSDRPINEDL